MKQANQYQVIVGNLGTVYNGTSRLAAMRDFRDYQDAAVSPHGSTTAESVTLCCNGEPVKESFPYLYEYTDTFGGQANYAWTRTGMVHACSLREAVKLSKAALGLSGIRCDGSAEYGLRPRGSCTVLFVNMADEP